MKMDKTDVVIILGDFGGLWDYRGENAEEKYWLDWLDSKPFTTCFIDGNHECFPRLFALPAEERFGAPAGIVRDSVFYLKRGYVYDINGKTIFTFGGASSHDIHEGIVNPDGKDQDWKKTAEQWRRQGRRFFRINGVSWWKDEIEQNPEVYKRGLDLLEQRDNKVDFIFTHCCPSSTQALLGFRDPDSLNSYLQHIQETVQYKHWYFGHYHMNRTVNGNEHCLYEMFEQIA
jgi:hypothetical protein